MRSAHGLDRARCSVNGEVHYDSSKTAGRVMRSILPWMFHCNESNVSNADCSRNVPWWCRQEVLHNSLPGPDPTTSIKGWRDSGNALRRDGSSGVMIPERK